MAAAVDSPFVLDISKVDVPLPSGGTFVAGRRRRINNDPYGGEGYVWEDITAPADNDQDISSETIPDLEHESPNVSSQIQAEEPVILRSVAAQRLDQLRQHLIDLSLSQEVSRSQRPYQGYSIDNLHLSMAGLQDWQSPQASCAQYSDRFSAPNPNSNQEWQQYTRNAIFGPGLRPQVPPIQSIGDTGASITPHAPYQQKLGRERLDTEQSPLHSLRSELAFEMDVHCNSWSSLMAQRRRKIAAVAW
jgi:hypothetical protein